MTPEDSNNNSLKILHTCAHAAGNLGVQLAHIAEQATAANHISFIASADSEAKVEHILRQGGIHLHAEFNKPTHPFKAPIEGFKLAAHVRENAIDVIHAHDARTIASALWAGRFAKVPVVAHLNATKTPKKVLKAIQGATTQSHFMAEQIGIKWAHILPPCYSPKRLKDIDAKKIDALWAQWDVPAATPVLLVTEPMAAESNYDILIEALGRMKKLHFKAIICTNYTASQELFTNLWKRIEALGISKEILFVDPPTTAEEAQHIYAASDVVAFTNANPEADAADILMPLAIGRPVIVASQTNRAELVDSGNTGWWVKLGNPETASQKLQLALTDALTDMTRLQKMGTSATRLCKEHHTAAHVCADLFAFYGSIRHAYSQSSN